MLWQKKGNELIALSNGGKFDTGAIDERIGALDLETVGEQGSYIETIKQEDGQVSATKRTMITNIGDNSTSINAPTAKAVADYVKAGSGLSKETDGTIKHSNAVDAGTIGTSSATSGLTIAIPYANYDAQGHVTGSGTHNHTVSTVTLPSAEVAATSTASAISTYVRNQNILSATEKYSISTSNQTVNYDGVISIVMAGTGSSQVKEVYVNDTLMFGTTTTDRAYGMVDVKKGDRIRATAATHSCYARWYKNRDYTGR